MSISVADQNMVDADQESGNQNIDSRRRESELPPKVDHPSEAQAQDKVSSIHQNLKQYIDPLCVYRLNRWRDPSSSRNLRSRTSWPTKISRWSHHRSSAWAPGAISFLARTEAVNLLSWGPSCTCLATGTHPWPNNKREECWTISPSKPAPARSVGLRSQPKGVVVAQLAQSRASTRTPMSIGSK